MSERDLTHINQAGEAHMVDVGGKPSTRRRAVAEGFVAMSDDLVSKFFGGELSKGDAVAVARVAGIQGAKRASDLIPLCHPIPLDSVEVDIAPGRHGVAITATVTCTGPTGVEMEALSAVSATALTVYDMVKSVERGVTIEMVRLREKEGGRTGHWSRPEIVD